MSEGFSLGKNDRHSYILEGGDVEEGRVLIVPDVFMVLRISYINSEREDGPGNITSAAGKEKNAENEDKCLLLQTKNAKIKHDKGK